ncbi:protein spire homolog 1-like isoform X3 [Anguilla anguilla]|uniref:protein spire homolog 1-like isoform X3 n=1 Tax=Anguilla anguilla TaxID=7936 RepID=UPI0015AFE271|nr:protein spire homolog 1-like isoform X3 [Anguilla anguilla]
MAKRLAPALQQDHDDELNPGHVNMDCGDEEDELSLDEILMLYGQPINEEQAWAVCYQCCRSLAQGHRRRNSKSATASVGGHARRIEGPGDVKIHKDGMVRLQFQGRPDKYGSPCTSSEVIESLGIMIYKALDFGLKESEERELSPPLEQLIDLMTNMPESERDACPDEGYEATEEEEDEDGEEGLAGAGACYVRGYRDILKLCTSHLPSPSDAPIHYQAVCRALYAETRELCTFLEKIKSAKENLRKMEGVKVEEQARDLNELQNADWARFWVQVMRDLRNGVKLKKVQERQYNPLAIEFQLTPYEMLMDDIRSKRYNLRKVMVNGDVPPKLKKSAHEVILDFIRSRPPLNPVAARKLKPHPYRPRSLHERILDEIKSERKLRPVSPDEMRRSRLVIRPLSMSYSFDLSGAGKSFSTPQVLLCGPDVSSPATQRNLSMSALALSNGMPPAQRNGAGGAQALSQRKRLLKAPTLAELDSSDSDDDTTRVSASSSSIATSLLDDTSPESAVGKKTPPMFLPISSTPQPERRQASQRRHSIEKETPTSVRQFMPPTRQSSKSLVGRIIRLFLRIPLHPTLSALRISQGSHSLEASALGVVLAVFALCESVYTGRRNPAKEEFCYPVECLSLTVEEVMHIRQVLVKAELEKFQQYKDVYNALKKGKLCFCCRTKRFSFFTWSYTCQFCKRPVCSQCCKKMRLPSKPYASLPIYSLGSSALPKGEAAGQAEKPSTSHRHGLQRTVSRLSKHREKSRDEGELPRELTEDWSTMEVCVDCKKFISEIISSSKHSLSLATKRARLKRKTQSFYMSSPKASEFHPSERTIKEV